MPDIRPFKIEISDERLDQLKAKLELTTLPGEMDVVNQEDGPPVADLERLISYWKSGFDWRASEAKLNQFPQFKTEVEIEKFGNIDIHFLHVRSHVENAVPLIFVHGWPGSFLEGTKIIPLLTDPEEGPAFHVVVASLPNFGFSSRITKKDFGIPQYAEAMHKVMLALGYNQYVTQGGDWGFYVTRALVHKYPDHALAQHTNFPASGFPSPLSAPITFVRALLKFASIIPVIGPLFKPIPFLSYSPSELDAFKRAEDWQKGNGRGYFSMLTTKPRVMAYTFADSPSGLLSFILDKLYDWTDNYNWTDDEILTWVSIYWFSEAGPGASGFIYKEIMKGMMAGDCTHAKLVGPSPGKIGVTWFPKEIVSLPKLWASGLGDVVFVGSHEKGGHFAAWERPEDLASDLRKMFGKGGGAFGVVKGNGGY